MENGQTLTSKAIDAKLLMVGACASTYRLADLVVKITRVDEYVEITQENVKAMKVEANVYTILGSHCKMPLRHSNEGYDRLQFHQNGNRKR